MIQKLPMHPNMFKLHLYVFRIVKWGGQTASPPPLCHTPPRHSLCTAVVTFQPSHAHHCAMSAIDHSNESNTQPAAAHAAAAAMADPPQPTLSAALGPPGLFSIFEGLDNSGQRRIAHQSMRLCPLYR